MAYTTIDDPSAHFHIQLYTGTGSSRSVTNDANAGDFAPDLLWIKERSATSSHVVFDTNRPVSSGYAPNLHTDSTAVEDGDTSELTAFNSNGFTYGDDGKGNENTQTYVAWQWKANGGTTSSNSDGDITSTVQANTTAGFSIVTYTGNGTDGASIGHGLSGAWDVIIVKNRGQTDYWTVDSDPTSGTTSALLLHDPSQQAGHGTVHFRGSSGLFTAHSNGDLGMGNGNTETYVAYVFKEVQGYSKFGTYTGNNNADGPFVYLGFKPAWVMFKRTNGSADWGIVNIKSSPRAAGTETNDMAYQLEPNQNAAEANQIDFWFLSNGFKLDGSGSYANGSGDTYFYMAFAEHPFVSSKGVPCTAR